MEFTLLFAAFFGVAGLWLMLRWEAARGNAADCAADLWEIAITAAVVGVFIGRLAAMIGDGVNPITNPADILIVRAGVATGWASAAALVTVAWLGRKELWPAMDGLAPAALAALGGWHAGCLARATCLGTTTDLPWGVAQSPGGPGRHPVEIYAAVLFLVVAIAVALWKARGRPAAGLPAAIALIAAGGIRLTTEPFRPSLGGGPVWWYLAAIAIGAIGGVVAVRLRRRRPSDSQP
ncbi:MAG: prolipoprotein diacylglyceryl transferase [Acidimicrobiia bacterium]|nr:prolipoprotein diacylglyceryl transferase [Acidimicrobiia bacterium]